ncbi:MAG: hypothetical protein O7B35_12590 [Deltaproteobacteria bacterium]|nr:hypothetical protein [Deltaproteobacteria bacterium]
MGEELLLLPLWKPHRLGARGKPRGMLLRNLLVSSHKTAERQPRGETCRARAQERTGCLQARTWGVGTLGADGAVADKAQAY